MVIFCPYLESLEESMTYVMEFEDFDLMKKYISDFYNKNFGKVDINDIIIDGKGTYDDVTYWEDKRKVCLTKFNNVDYIEKFGSPQCIGFCATKYKKIRNLLNKKIKY